MKVVLVGHLTLDRLSDGRWRWGGGVYYCAMVYVLMGFEVHICTTTHLPQYLISSHFKWGQWQCKSGRSLCFENRYDARAQRMQWVSHVPDVMTPADFDLSRFKGGVDILHLCPVFNELDVDDWVGHEQMQASFVGLGVQGLLRARGHDGRVVECFDALKPWAVDLVFVSEEDLSYDLSHLMRLGGSGSLVALTQGARGGVLYDVNGQSMTMPVVERVDVMDPTGAGDVFSAAFLASCVCQGADMFRAAASGAAAASLVVESAGLGGLRRWGRLYDERLLGLL